jgi:hypothetical protein
MDVAPVAECPFGDTEPTGDLGDRQQAFGSSFKL